MTAQTIEISVSRFVLSLSLSWNVIERKTKNDSQWLLNFRSVLFIILGIRFK